FRRGTCGRPLWDSLGSGAKQHLMPRMVNLDEGAIEVRGNHTSNNLAVRPEFHPSRKTGRGGHLRGTVGAHSHLCGRRNRECDYKKVEFFTYRSAHYVLLWFSCRESQAGLWALARSRMLKMSRDDTRAWKMKS